MGAQIVTTLALTLTLVWAPGLLWSSARWAPELRAVFLIGTGPLVLVALGMLIWLVAGVIAPTVAALFLVALWWAAIGVGLWRRAGALEALDAHTWRIIGVSGLLALAAVAKASTSRGPRLVDRWRRRRCPAPAPRAC